MNLLPLLCFPGIFLVATILARYEDRFYNWLLWDVLCAHANLDTQGENIQ